MFSQRPLRFKLSGPACRIAPRLELKTTRPIRSSSKNEILGQVVQSSIFAEDLFRSCPIFGRRKLNLEPPDPSRLTPQWGQDSIAQAEGLGTHHRHV